MTEEVIVTVNEGRVRGFQGRSIYSGVEYYSFLGIPYGQSTAGDGRFKAPIKVTPWDGVLDATTAKEGCLQFSLMKKRICGTEDCLYNNIFTTQIPKKGDPLKSVIVNFHPGGFFHGSPDLSSYGSPEFVINRDIVYVCIAHRLHILGYLNLGLEDCSGNQALKDIALGLQWIKDNISAFGGDPENITILGSSGGAATIHYLMVSPLARGLYHKAIIMSGYAFNPDMVTPLEHISAAYETALRLGYQGDITDKEKLLQFYKNLPMKDFFKIRPEQFFNDRTLPVYPLSPFLPTTDYGKNSAIPVRPDKLIDSINRVPLMFGFCQREGVMALIRPMKENLRKFYNTVLRQNEIGWGSDLADEELEYINEQIRSFYLNNGSIEDAPQAIICDILTDISFSDAYDSLINVISEDLPSSVYLYKFHYDGNICIMKAKIAPSLEEPLDGNFHAADYSYWCYIEETAGKDMNLISAKDKEIIEIMTNLITSFAKTGNPNYDGLPVQWKPSTPTEPHHLVINDTLQVKDELLNGKRMQFWHDIRAKIKQDRCDKLFM